MFGFFRKKGAPEAQQNAVSKERQEEIQNYFTNLAADFTEKGNAWVQDRARVVAARLLNSFQEIIDGVELEGEYSPVDIVKVDFNIFKEEMNTFKEKMTEEFHEYFAEHISIMDELDLKDAYETFISSNLSDIWLSNFLGAVNIAGEKIITLKALGYKAELFAEDDDTFTPPVKD